METRRFLIAIGLSVLVLVGWQYLFGPEPPTDFPQRDSGQAVTPEEPPAATSAPPASVTEAPELEVAPAEAPGAQPEPAPAPAAIQPEAAEAERRVVVEGARFQAEFTNRGAQLVSFRLVEHPSADGGLVDLVRSRAAPPYPFALRLPDRSPSPLNDALFVAEESVEEGARIVEFRYAGPAGRATKRFTFRPDGMFDVELDVPGGGELLLGPGIRNPVAAEIENRFTRRAALYRTSEDLERLDPARVDDPVIVAAPGVRWLGIDDTYFLISLIPTTPFEALAIEPVMERPGPSGAEFLELPSGGEVGDEQKELQREVRVAVRLAPDGRFGAAAYWGAKKYERLAALPYGLQESVNLGFFGFLSRPLMIGLRWIYENVVSNYGWAIILMTILIRIVLFPLTHKSFVSMQKMQKLNPQMQAIRQKYRPKLKDKQGRPNTEMQRKMNEEIMGLYKKEGVNPAGGCLPMLLQIPVLFAFYSLLSTAVELRYAPWMFWIQDLSAKDPLYVLPIVMGASQFLQQRLTPSSADPMQRRIFMLMPIFFTVLFLGFPSGLVLYWLTNNVLGIGQQWAYKRIQEKKEAEQKASGGRSGKKG